jgi:hypothetical protein
MYHLLWRSVSDCILYVCVLYNSPSTYKKQNSEPQNVTFCRTFPKLYLETFQTYTRAERRLFVKKKSNFSLVASGLKRILQSCAGMVRTLSVSDSCNELTGRNIDDNTTLWNTITRLKCFPVAAQQTSYLTLQRSPSSPHFPDSDECGNGGGTLPVHCGNHGSESVLFFENYR